MPKTSNMPETPSNPYNIDDWCKEAHVSRPFVYKLWGKGTGPRSVKVGRRRLITETPSLWLQRFSSLQGDAA